MFSVIVYCFEIKYNSVALASELFQLNPVDDAKLLTCKRIPICFSK